MATKVKHKASAKAKSKAIFFQMFSLVFLREQLLSCAYAKNARLKHKNKYVFGEIWLYLHCKFNLENKFNC